MTRLYYYTGTGNSLWAARQLAERLDGPVELVSLGTDYTLPGVDCDRIGLVFPVHMWGLPRRVVEFIRQLKPLPNCYFFALALNAGQVAGTLLQLEKLLARQNNVLGSGFGLSSPSNYILWNGDIGCNSGTGTHSYYVSEVSRFSPNRPLLVTTN